MLLPHLLAFASNPSLETSSLPRAFLIPLGLALLAAHSFLCLSVHPRAVSIVNSPLGAGHPLLPALSLKALSLDVSVVLSGRAVFEGAVCHAECVCYRKAKPLLKEELVSWGFPQGLTAL